jgi:hypothetical protein
MAIVALKEVTEWKVDYRQPNHTYLVDGDRILAYRKWHVEAPVFFTTPPRLHKSYRKFIKTIWKD